MNEKLNFNSLSNEQKDLHTVNAIKGLAKDIGCNYYYLKGNIFDGYDLSIDDSLEARDLLHDTVDQQNFHYEKFRELYVK